MIPTELRARLEDPELYHQILEHNWYLAEQAQAEVPLEVAVQSYVDTVLSRGKVIVDDNQLWAGAIARASATVRYFALGLVFLMCAAAGAVIVFAARAALSMRRDIAEALHLVGAPDRFIVALFQERFFMLGVKSGAAGALLALLTSLCLNYAGGSAGTVFFLPGLAPGWGIIIIVPAAALASGIIAGLAARLTVRAGLLARWP